MTLAAVRLAMMDTLITLSGVHVPSDPLPAKLDDKTIVIFPSTENSTIMSKGRDRGIATTATGSMQIEYHRRIPYEKLGTTIGDITTMVDTIRDLFWKEMVGGFFGGTVTNIENIALEHLGALGWNEWTFGARLMVSFRYLTTIDA